MHIYVVMKLRSRYKRLDLRNTLIVPHFLWEVSVEPWQPCLVAAAVVWTTSITVPQWVIKSNSSVVLPLTGDSRFTIVIIDGCESKLSTNGCTILNLWLRSECCSLLITLPWQCLLIHHIIRNTQLRMYILCMQKRKRAILAKYKHNLNKAKVKGVMVIELT